MFWPEEPTEDQACQMTAGLMPICPNIELNNHPVSLYTQSSQYPPIFSKIPAKIIEPLVGNVWSAYWDPNIWLFRP